MGQVSVQQMGERSPEHEQTGIDPLFQNRSRRYDAIRRVDFKKRIYRISIWISRDSWSLAPPLGRACKLQVASILSKHDAPRQTSVGQFRAELNDQLGRTSRCRLDTTKDGVHLFEKMIRAVGSLLVGRTFHAFPSVFTLLQEQLPRGFSVADTQFRWEAIAERERTRDDRVFPPPLEKEEQGTRGDPLTGGERRRGCHCVTNDGEFLTSAARDGSPSRGTTLVTLTLCRTKKERKK